MTIRPAHPAALEHVRVADCMHHGIFTCDPDASVREVASIMARHHVHAVAVTERNVERPVAIVSALDVAAAVATGDELNARQVAGTEYVAVPADQPVQLAAHLMTEHGVSHLIVLDAAGGFPAGVISTLDIASAYAG
jgi:CBS domain-containing protein